MKLSSTQIQQYARDGFLIFPELFSREEVAKFGMILVVSGVIVRDLIKTFVKPDLSDHAGARLGTTVSLAVGVVVIGLALKPPAYLEYLIIYAIGGLEVLLFVPIIAGLYWRRGNSLGAALGMVGGATWYVVANEWVPDLTLGMFPIATASAVAFALYLIGSYVGPPPRHEVLVKFWGSQRAIDEMLATSGAAAGKPTLPGPGKRRTQ